jgi:hypothetical protein
VLPTFRPDQIRIQSQIEVALACDLLDFRSRLPKEINRNTSKNYQFCEMGGRLEICVITWSAGLIGAEAARFFGSNESFDKIIESLTTRLRS